MFRGAGQDGGGVTARRANGERGRAAAVANGERGTRCHVPRLRGHGGAAPGLGQAVLYWANWERPGRALKGEGCGAFTPFLRLLSTQGSLHCPPPGYSQPPPGEPSPVNWAK